MLTPGQRYKLTKFREWLTTKGFADATAALYVYWCRRLVLRASALKPDALVKVLEPMPMPARRCATSAWAQLVQFAAETGGGVLPRAPTMEEIPPPPATTVDGFSDKRLVTKGDQPLPHPFAHDLLLLLRCTNLRARQLPMIVRNQVHILRNDRAEILLDPRTANVINVEGFALVKALQTLLTWSAGALTHKETLKKAPLLAKAPGSLEPMPLYTIARSLRQIDGGLQVINRERRSSGTAKPPSAPKPTPVVKLPSDPSKMTPEEYAEYCRRELF